MFDFRVVLVQHNLIAVSYQMMVSSIFRHCILRHNSSYSHCKQSSSILFDIKLSSYMVSHTHEIISIDHLIINYSLQIIHIIDYLLFTLSITCCFIIDYFPPRFHSVSITHRFYLFTITRRFIHYQLCLSLIVCYL